MTHEPTCDLTVYGPEAKGVFCTCDAPDDPIPLVDGSGAWVRGVPTETLQGDAAVALRQFRAAAFNLRRAQDAHTKALEDFTAAVAK